MTDSPSRYYVATTTGFPNATKWGTTQPGITAMVLDRLYHRPVALWRSEDEHAGTPARRRAIPIEKARRRAKELNCGSETC